jgi:cobalt transporter subunit CbtA
MKQFQHLMRTALLSGAIAGAVLFLFQWFVIVPRILAAEGYEQAEAHGDHEGHHHDVEWKPAEGLERTYYTAAATLLTGIGYAALLLAIASLSGIPLHLRNGLFWGLAGFASFVVAPALGLPPEPPGVPVADLATRQLWWVLTAAATAAALLFLAKSGGRWGFYLTAGVLILLPHFIGAPQAEGLPVVPAQLIREFSIASVLGNGLFWLTLGPVAGWVAR